MLGLLPVELWENRLGDIIRGLWAASEGRHPQDTLFIQGIGDCIPVRSARAAIYISLKALDLKPGAKVGVPLYCCPVVFKAITEARCTPRFIDIEPGTFCLSPDDLSSKRSQLDAVIAVHMFGHLCDMTRIREVMDGSPIIEDCAQSIGSKLDGRMTGTFGTIAAFSFRSGKYLSVGEGGALYSPHKELRSRISEILAKMNAPSHKEELVHVVTTLIRSILRGKYFWGPLGYPIWSLYNKKVKFTAKSPIILSPIFQSDLAVARSRLDRLGSMIHAQRSNAEEYVSHLRVDPGMLCRESGGAYYNRYLFPIIFPTAEHRNTMAAYLHSRKIGTARPYEDVIKGAAENYGYARDCPVSERLLKHTLVIPNHYHLKKQDIMRIVRSINTDWNHGQIRRSDGMR